MLPSAERSIARMTADYRLAYRGMFLILSGFRGEGEEQTLSLRRAELVRDEFVARGVPAGCVVAVDGAMTYRIDAVGSERNSRVEFRIDINPV